MIVDCLCEFCPPIFLFMLFMCHLTACMHGVGYGSFNALLEMLTMFTDLKQKATADFQAILDLYINEHFRSLTAHQHLLACVHFVMKNLTRKEMASQTISTMRVRCASKGVGSCRSCPTLRMCIRDHRIVLLCVVAALHCAVCSGLAQASRGRRGRR